MGQATVRVLVGAIGAIFILGGFATIAAGGSAGVVGFWGVVIGLVIVAVVLLERTRYRSEAHDDVGDAIGPGGGEPADSALEPRFRATGEVFRDPSTRRRMRVWSDPATGERRYVAED